MSEFRDYNDSDELFSKELDVIDSGLDEENESKFKSVRCYVCKKEGHLSKDCPKLICHNCQRPGHFARDCPKGNLTENKVLTCFICNRPGHVAKFCYQAQRYEGNYRNGNSERPMLRERLSRDIPQTYSSTHHDRERQPALSPKGCREPTTPPPKRYSEYGKSPERRPLASQPASRTRRDYRPSPLDDPPERRYYPRYGRPNEERTAQLQEHHFRQSFSPRAGGGEGSYRHMREESDRRIYKGKRPSSSRDPRALESVSVARYPREERGSSWEHYSDGSPVSRRGRDRAPHRSPDERENVRRHIRDDRVATGSYSDLKNSFQTTRSSSHRPPFSALSDRPTISRRMTPPPRSGYNVPRGVRHPLGFRGAGYSLSSQSHRPDSPREFMRGDREYNPENRLRPVHKLSSSMTHGGPRNHYGYAYEPDAFRSRRPLDRQSYPPRPALYDTGRTLPSYRARDRDRYEPPRVYEDKREIYKPRRNEDYDYPARVSGHPRY